MNQNPERHCNFEQSRVQLRQPLTCGASAEKELFIDNLLVRVCFIIVMITWTGLTSWELEFPSGKRLLEVLEG